MLIDYALGATGIILRFKLRNSAVSTGAGLTGLSNSSAGLVISTIADVETTPIFYSQAAGTIDEIGTVGQFSPPVTDHCGFAEVDPVHHKGIYELQLDDTRFAVTDAKSLLISLAGATNLAECDILVPLRRLDPYAATVDANVVAANGAPVTPADGTAQGGATNTITLAATDTGGTNAYLDRLITIVGGTGIGQSRYITAFNSATKVATVHRPWDTVPDTTSLYSLDPSAAVLVPGTVTAATVQDKTGYALAGAGLDAITIESGINARQALVPILAAAAGKVGGAVAGSPSTVTFTGGNNSTTRITATTDANGNRSAVTLALPA
jgi:hypothetical protein